MDKREIIADVHLMIATRLFGDRPWLADQEANLAISRKLDQLGLQEWVSERTVRATPLGNELELDLITAFLGHHAEWEVPMMLQDYRLIDCDTADEICEAPNFQQNAERILRPIVQKAFYDHYNPSGRAS
jgi:hypothetical protein